MSAKTIYMCDHCGAKCLGDEYARITFGKTIHGCTKEHLGLALAKAFGLPMDNNALRLVTEKNDALDAARAAIIECDNMRARLSKLEAQNHHAGELLAKAQARVAELEQAWDMLKKSLDESDLQRNEGLAKIADLEKRLAEATAPLAIDGKAPGQIAYAEYACLMGINPDLAECGVITATCWERAAQAVLRAFGPPLAKQAAVDALGKVRERIETDGLRIFEGERYGIDAIGCAVAMINTEISALESTKSVSITIPTKPTKPARVHGNCKACSGIGEIVCADCDGSGKHECAYCGGTGEYSAAEGNGQ